MTDIGRAGMVMKGDYNSASTYETLDAVSYLNGLYVAKQNVPAGTVPTNTTYWQKAADSTLTFDYIGEGPSGSDKTGTIALTHGLSDYSMIMIEYAAYLDKITQIVSSDIFTLQGSILQTLFGSTTVDSDGQFTNADLMTYCVITAIDNTHLSFSSKYSNSNWFLHPTRIFGIK